MVIMTFRSNKKLADNSPLVFGPGHLFLPIAYIYLLTKVYNFHYYLKDYKTINANIKI